MIDAILDEDGVVIDESARAFPILLPEGIIGECYDLDPSDPFMQMTIHRLQYLYELCS